MSTITQTYVNALLADAAYVNLHEVVNGQVQPDLLTGTALSDAIAVRMTMTQAEFITANFEVLNQELSTSGGFDAVVWRGKAETEFAGQIFVSMRGTQGTQDISDDISLATRGIPHQQIADMVNWWLRSTASDGAANVTQIRVVATPVSVLPGTFIYTFALAAPATGTGVLEGLDPITAVNGHSLGGYLATAFTRLFGAAFAVQSVNTFNSAGFSNVAGLNIEFEYNQIANMLGGGMGLGSFDAVAAMQTNFYAQNGIEVTTNSWADFNFLMPGFNQYGARQGLHQEDLLGLDPIANHYMFKLTDLLALGAALEKLDSTMTFAKLNDLIRVGSNVTAGSYEGVLDALRRMLNDPAAGSLPVGDAGDTAQPRKVLHETLKQVQDTNAYQSLIGKVKINAVTANIGVQALARVDFQTVVALETLSPFIVNGVGAEGQAALVALWQSPAWSQTYEGWQTDQALTDAQKAAGEQTFTDNYYKDRALLLQSLIARNALNRDAGQVVFEAALPGDRSFVFEFNDPTNPTSQSILLAQKLQPLPPYTSPPEQLIVFGGTANDTIEGSVNKLADHLYGGAGNDIITAQAGDDYAEGNADNDSLDGGEGADKLLGGTGDDTLVGGKQADILLGGVGNDIYILKASDGVNTDTIQDAGGQGSIKVFDASNAEITLGQGAITRVANATNLWISADKRFTYSTVVESDASITLTIGGAGVSAKVLKFEDGHLGITLPGLAPPKTVPQYNGINVDGDKAPVDFDPVAAGVQVQYDEWGNVIVADGSAPDRIDTLYDSPGNDSIRGFGGNDLIYASRGGSDQIYGDAGNDHAQLGAGDDFAELGDGRDNALGGADDDQLYGNQWIAVQTLLDQSVAGADSEADLLAGNEGNDSLLGGASADALWGGDGRDMLVGGAGDDNMFGDLTTSTVSLFWAAQRNPLITDGNGMTSFGYAISGVGFGYGAEPGADLMLGGAGSDALIGGAGEDHLDGGADNDFLFGDKPHVDQAKDFATTTRQRCRPIRRRSAPQARHPKARRCRCRVGERPLGAKFTMAIRGST